MELQACATIPIFMVSDSYLLADFLREKKNFNDEIDLKQLTNSYETDKIYLLS